MSLRDPVMDRANDELTLTPIAQNIFSLPDSQEKPSGKSKSVMYLKIDFAITYET